VTTPCCGKSPRCWAGSKREILHDALEYFRRAQMLRAMNIAFAALRASVLAERAGWDTAVDDVALGNAA
jgi:hypothetical protein